MCVLRGCTCECSVSIRPSLAICQAKTDYAYVAKLLRNTKSTHQHHQEDGVETIPVGTSPGRGGDQAGTLAYSTNHDVEHVSVITRARRGDCTIRWEINPWAWHSCSNGKELRMSLNDLSNSGCRYDTATKKVTATIRFRIVRTGIYKVRPLWKLLCMCRMHIGLGVGGISTLTTRGCHSDGGNSPISARRSFAGQYDRICSESGNGDDLCHQNGGQHRY